MVLKSGTENWRQLAATINSSGPFPTHEVKFNSMEILQQVKRLQQKRNRDRNADIKSTFCYMVMNQVHSSSSVPP